MSKCSNLHNAKKNKNDEFYTRLEDIEKELCHYERHFKGASVYCNCDNPEYSNFWRYFHVNFERLGLSALMASYYDKDGEPQGVIYAGGFDDDISAGYIMLDAGGERIGDDVPPSQFQDAAPTLLKSADIIVSNPPFSKFRSYVQMLSDAGKQMLVLGNINAMSYKNIFPLLRDNKLWMGYTKPKGYITESGEFKSFGNTCWYTNLDIDKRHVPFEFKAQYTGNESHYPMFYNLAAINVNKVADIPGDYYGLMGVPISFIDKYNPDEFEILGFDVLNPGEIGIQPVGDAWVEEYKREGFTGHFTPCMRLLVMWDKNGVKTPYRRMIIRRKGGAKLSLGGSEKIAE